MIHDVEEMASLRQFLLFDMQKSPSKNTSQSRNERSFRIGRLSRGVPVGLGRPGWIGMGKAYGLGWLISRNEGTCVQRLGAGPRSRECLGVFDSRMEVSQFNLE